MVLRRYTPEEWRDDLDVLVPYGTYDESAAHLGSLLVDFDDLRDLVELLRSGDRSGHEVEILFVSGRATEVDDLREVTDQELAEGISVRVGNVLVELYPESTLVRGPGLLVACVKDMWAKYRRTQAWSRYGRTFWAQLLSLSSVSLTTFLIGLYGFATTPKWIYPTLVFLAIATPTLLIRRRRRGTTVFFPGTRQERRQDRPLQRRHRFQMSMTMLGSIVVPVISLVLTLVLKK
ncbi:hypothetical protein [Saccharopolyspora sp. NPDC002376]